MSPVSRRGRGASAPATARSTGRSRPCGARTAAPPAAAPVPVSPWEADRLGIAGAVVTPVHPGTSRCAFHVDGGCSVYERRPFICPLYGTAAVAPCERGQTPTTLIPTGRAVRMVERFEAGCPPSWQDDRRAAVREAITAAGNTDALATLDAHREALEGARTAVGALTDGPADGAMAGRTSATVAVLPGDRAGPR